MHNSLQKDIVILNRRYLLLIKQMDEENHPLLPACTPNSVVKTIKSMSLEDIDRLAEDMTAPLFHLNINEKMFGKMEEQKPGSIRKAYMTNVLVTQLQTNEKR